MDYSFYFLGNKYSSLSPYTPLSATVEKISIGERTYLFADAYVVCLDENVTREMVEQLAAIEPTPIKYVFGDSAFNDDISLKDETVRRLEAYISRNNGENKKAYTVEFIKGGNMKRDMDLVRKILFELEDKPNTRMMGFTLEGCDKDEISYHCQIMFDGNLIQEFTLNLGNQGEILFYKVRGLTWAGHYLLDKIREDTIWKKQRTL